MKSLFILFVTLLVIGTYNFYAAKKLYDINSQQRESLQYVSKLPPQIAKIASLEFKGISADYLMLRTMTFIGDHFQSKIRPSKEQFHQIYDMLVMVINLDPLFWDPYLLTQTMLILEGEMVDEGSQLLLQAAELRPEDYRPFFLLWYNNYYVKKNIEQAEHYLHQAIKRPNAPEYLKLLAARMSYYSGRVENGIVVLEELIKETTNPSIKESLIKRQQTLKILFSLEAKKAEYEKKQQVQLGALEELIITGLIEQIPKDPYGGSFYVARNGRIYTTSKLVNVE